MATMVRNFVIGGLDRTSKSMVENVDLILEKRVAQLDLVDANAMPVKEVKLDPKSTASPDPNGCERFMRVQSSESTVSGGHGGVRSLFRSNSKNAHYTAEFNELLTAGRDELLKSSILSLRHLADEKIVSLMQLIDESDNGRANSTTSRFAISRNNIFNPAIPFFRLKFLWTKLRKLVGSHMFSRSRPAMYRVMTCISMTRSKTALHMSEAVASVLQRRYLADLYHLALPPCDISTIVKAMIEGGVSKLQYLELEGALTFQSIYPKSKLLKRLFMSGLLSGVHHLRFSRCIETDDMDYLARAIERRKIHALRHLDLSYNFLIGEEGIRRFAQMISTGVLSDLEHLNLQNCGITDDGMQAIANAMKAQGPLKLQYLNIGSNEIEEEGFAALARVMRAGLLVELKELHLLYNYGIGEESKVVIANILEEGKLPALEILYMSSHSITDSIARALLNAFKNNTQVTVELLGVWWPNENVEREVASYRERNLLLAASARNLSVATGS